MLINPTSVFSICVLFTPILGQQLNVCNDVLGQTFRPDQHSCQAYHFCTPARIWKLNCGQDTVWNQNLRRCVQKGSANDTCFIDSKGHSVQLRHQQKVIVPNNDMNNQPKLRHQLQVIVPNNDINNQPKLRHQLKVIVSNNVINNQRNQQPTSPFMISPIEKGNSPIDCGTNSPSKIAHPSRCAQYYDCASNAAEDWWGVHLRECLYPKLFNDITNECDDYQNVQCGNRLEPKDSCDYVQHLCRSGNCVPCHIRFPTCIGFGNGLHKWRGRDKSPYFTQCVDNRMTLNSRCQSSDPGSIMIFDEKTQVCVLAA